MDQVGIEPGEDTFRLLVESVVDYAIYLLDPDGRIASWNAGAARLTGYAAPEVLGAHVSKLYPEEGAASGIAERELHRARSDGRHEEEGWRARKDGSRFWANVVVTCLRDGHGAVRGFATVTRDHTARKRAEEELRESEERFRLLVEGVQDYAIFMLDPTGHIVSWNRGAERIKGYAEHEILGRHFSVFYTPADTARDHPAEELASARELGRFEEEGWRVRKDGSRFWANVVITALRDEHGELRGFAKVTRDVTERRASDTELRRLHAELEQRVRERTRQLHEANEDLSSFARTVAHDLRAPLRAMQGFAQALAEDYGPSLDETAREYLDRIASSAERMDRLIRDLLEYSQLGRRELTSGSVDLGAAVDAAILRLEAELPRASAQVVVRRPLAAVRANDSAVISVLQNLISNGLKFVRPGDAPRVQVWTEPRGGTVRCWVADEGIGIAPEHHARIFRAFERLHGNEQYSGTGIGLATVARAVERMGGEAGVESRPGAGSRFWFELPRAMGAEAHA